MTSDRELGIACLTYIGLSTAEAEAFFDQFRQPRCTVCEGTGESITGAEYLAACAESRRDLAVNQRIAADLDRKAGSCRHCGGSGKEPSA